MRRLIIVIIAGMLLALTGVAWFVLMNSLLFGQLETTDAYFFLFMVLAGVTYAYAMISDL